VPTGPRRTDAAPCGTLSGGLIAGAELPTWWTGGLFRRFPFSPEHEVAMRLHLIHALTLAVLMLAITVVPILA